MLSCASKTQNVRVDMDEESWKNMCFRDFSETITYTWIPKNQLKLSPSIRSPGGSSRLGT